MTRIYFISQRGHVELVKIGIANDPEKRLAEMQTGSGFRLKLLATATLASRAEAMNLERDLHHAFRSRRVRGEWFTCSAALRELIASVRDGDAARGAAAFKRARKESAKHEGIVAVQMGKGAVLCSKEIER